MTRPLCKNKCGNLTKLVEKGDKFAQYTGFLIADMIDASANNADQ